MRNLQPSTDYTNFWCAMSLIETSPYDDKKELSIEYQSDPDLSVQRSEVSGEAGGDVSVLCRYSARYRREKKRWCRLRDQRCSSVGGFRSPADPNEGWDPQMRDDGSGTLSVEMVGVKQTDSGWYWCEVGDLQRPVYLNIIQQPAISIPTTTNRNSHGHTNDVNSSETTKGITGRRNNTWVTNATVDNNEVFSGHVTLPVLIGVAGLLLLLAVVGLVFCKTCGRNRASREKNNLTYAPVTLGTNSQPEDSLTYSTVALKERSNNHKQPQGSTASLSTDHPNVTCHKPSSTEPLDTAGAADVVYSAVSRVQ
ncbi:hypothetical protein AALO_G00010390 [Alosa alosa]|uniref:Ig-like domain-containing protein n=2 Tax=Alosa alosa TaxID=278164 RepID=A0AAV6HJH3_9TELE|nr:hypothetical protein AALO_G00010390 [Alosa alosa]